MKYLSGHLLCTVAGGGGCSNDYIVLNRRRVPGGFLIDDFNLYVSRKTFCVSKVLSGSSIDNLTLMLDEYRDLCNKSDRLEVEASNHLLSALAEHYPHSHIRSQFATV